MKRGVSLVSLAIIIVVMLILTSIVVISGFDTMSATTINTFAVEILNIQTTVDEYYYKYNKYPVGEDITINVSDIAEGSLEQFNAETIIDNNITLKIIDLSLLGINENKFGNKEVEKDVYALSEETGKVYYLIGVRYEENIYYTLTDALFEMVGMTDIANNTMVPTKDTKVYDVVFSPSNVGYTNMPVTVTIRLPKEAVINEIAVTGEKSLSEETVQGAYKYVKVNETSTDKTGNYEIEVNYTYNGANKISKYAVTNYDSTVPTLSITETNSDGMTSVNVTTVDIDSGVKIVKYADEEIEDAAYFKYYGTVLNGSELKLKLDPKYTIYVEDKAGNYNIIKTEEYAIYSVTDNSLTFTRTGEEIIKGGTYNGKEVTEAYTGFEDAAAYTSQTQVPWYNNRENITSVMVEDKIQPTSTAYWFYEFNNCSNLDVTKLDASKTTSMKYMFGYCGNATAVTNFKITGMNNWNTSNVTDMSYVFREAGKNATTWSIGDLSKWDTSKVTNMTNMFNSTGQNATWLLDLSGWKVSLVTLYEGFNEYVTSKVIAPNFN